MMSAPGFLEVVEPLFNVFSPALVGLLLAALLFLAVLSGLPLAAHSIVFFVSTVRHAALHHSGQSWRGTCAAAASSWQVRWHVAIALNRLPKPKTENAWQVWQVIPIVISIRLLLPPLFSTFLC